jgi:SAM-dependent methyltransferase
VRVRFHDQARTPDLPHPQRRLVRVVRRLLRPGGRFAAATFFASGPEGVPHIADRIETVESGIDVIHPVGDFEANLRDAGLEQVEVRSIGEHVWRGFDRWMSQTEYRDSWGRNWLRCYENGWIDYYILTARR